MDMKQMMKQARKMQQQLEDVQNQLKEVEVDATAGGGMVKATVFASGELKSIQIDKEAVDPEEVELLQDMVVAAVNEALRSAQELSNQRMSSIAGGMNIPGLF